ncbi:MAG: ABC transporter substrate-binding protein [Actinobacteria bacterium]|jgi:NitT/TauT family transport system substrate-binding protein|nr:ABC transporter substrate-binding protein [Actinomycetota bacterium]
MSLPKRLAAVALAASAASLTLSACGGSATADAGSQAAEKVTTLRLGFFPNLTHAPALVGLQEGLFKAALKPVGVTVTPTAFNAGPDAITALFAGSLDIAYIGPNPTINAYAQSKGAAVRVIAGAASGGASLVVRPEIADAAALKGRTLATPQLGNTQDVALRYWLQEQGLSTTTEGGGDVSVKPQANAEGLAAYAAGSIDGAWVPEPWVSEYVKAGAKVLVDEKSLWPDGKFVTTNIIVRTEFLQQHPDIVTAFLEGHVAALDAIGADPAAAKAAVNASLQSLTGSTLDATVLDAAWEQVDFTADPLPATLVESSSHAVTVGLLDQGEIDEAGGLPGSLYDVTAINAVLKAAGKPSVSTP